MKFMPDFGNPRDNEAAFLVAASSINSGDVDWGEQILTQLRDHIMQSGEIKNRMWIRPQILEALSRLRLCKAVV